MERQGSDIGKIIDAYENAANYELELTSKFFSNWVCFIVTLWNLNFKASQDGTLNGTLNDALGEEYVKLISLLKAEPSITQVLAAEKLVFSKRKVQRMMKSLSERGYIKREGSKKIGRWAILKDV